MTSQETDIETAIPDLREIPVSRLAEPGPSVLTYSIALSHEGFGENVVPLSSFRARI